MPSRAQARRWRSLKRRKGRAEHGLFVAEGHRLLEDLLASSLRVRQVLYTASGFGEPEVRRLLERAGERGIELEEVSAAELAEFADTVTPQGILVVAEIPGWSRDDVGEGDLLVLDAVQDPGNAGTILRTAEALGVAGVVSLKGTVDVWNPKVVRASAGALFRLPVLHETWPDAEGRLRAAGYRLWASDTEGEAVDRASDVPRGIALVLGNEGAGVRQEILAAADRRVAIRLRGGAESLNVAVAAALLMDRIFSARRT